MTTTGGDDQDTEVGDFNAMLNELAGAGEHHPRVSVADVLATIGQRSFAPLLFVAGVVLMSPIAAIPGVGVAVDIVVLLIAGQMLAGRKHFWVPKFIRRRSIDRARFAKSIRALRPAARAVDRVLRPRLGYLVRPPFTHLMAAVCIMSALVFPVLSVVPFLALIPASAITAFGLALIAHDGAFAVAGFTLSVATVLVIAAAIYI